MISRCDVLNFAVSARPVVMCGTALLSRTLLDKPGVSFLYSDFRIFTIFTTLRFNSVLLYNSVFSRILNLGCQ